MKVSTIAVGVILSLTPTADGGRQTPLLGGHAREDRFTYRPNWGLPGWEDGEQTAGPLLGFSETNIHPGDQVRAILVALFPEQVPAWADIQVGDSLRMYEGSRICGVGQVVWTEPTFWFMPTDEGDRLTQWLSVG